MKVLIVGLGGIGQRHARNLRALLGSSVEIMAYRVRGHSRVLTDRLTLEAASRVEEKYAIRAYGDLDQALAQAPDSVFVCNPSSLHIPVALSAAQAGCHLFIEKPLSSTLESAKTVLK
ncbi:MAG: Gfo/Idh/MocA family oxidoreductase, partial [Armatimonadota bacterium]